MLLPSECDVEDLADAVIKLAEGSATPMLKQFRGSGVPDFLLQRAAVVAESREEERKQGALKQALKRYVDEQIGVMMKKDNVPDLIPIFNPIRERINADAHTIKDAAFINEMHWLLDQDPRERILKPSPSVNHATCVVVFLPVWLSSFLSMGWLVRILSSTRGYLVKSNGLHSSSSVSRSSMCSS